MKNLNESFSKTRFYHGSEAAADVKHLFTFKRAHAHAHNIRILCTFTHSYTVYTGNATGKTVQYIRDKGKLCCNIFKMLKPKPEPKIIGIHACVLATFACYNVLPVIHSYTQYATRKAVQSIHKRQVETVL